MWADTTIGNVANDWQTEGSYTDAATLSEGQTRTFTFTVDELGSGWASSYCLNLTNTAATAVWSENCYAFLRSCDLWYVMGTVSYDHGDTNANCIYDESTYGNSLSQSIAGGATVVMTVRRQNKHVLVTSEITTTSSVKYYRNTVLNLDTDADIYCILAADNAVLTIKSDATTTTSTLGATGSKWLTSGSYSDYYSIASGKELTLTFFVSASARNDAANGYCLQIRNNTTSEDVWNTNTYAFLRSACDYISLGVWNTNATYNVNNYGSADKLVFFVGATVTSTIRRYGEEIIVTTEITKSGTTYTHSYVQNIGTTDNIYVYLGADYSVLVPMTAVIDDSDVSVTNPVEIPVGASDFTDAWNAVYNQVLAPESSVSFHFTNYNNGLNQAWLNWTTGFTYNDADTDSENPSDKYFDVTSADLLPWGTLYENSTPATATSTMTNWPSDVMSALNGADVTMTMSRCGRKVYINAVHKSTDGTWFAFKYTFEPNAAYTNFATSNIWVRLVARSSYFTLYYPTDKISTTIGETGWTTFASEYPLNLSGIEESTDEVTAYYASAVGTNSVTATSTDDAVAAGTGLLLKGTANTMLTIPVAASGSDISDDNLLVGCTTSTTLGVNEDYYVLVNNGGTAEFQSLSENGATIPAGKAYLNAATSGARLSIVFDENGETGISSPLLTSPAGEELQDGKYLENGKIVIVKNGVKYNVNGQRK